MTDTDRLIRRFIGGDPAAAADIAERAERDDDPAVLVAAALIGACHLDRAATRAATTRDRHLVAIAAAHLDGAHDLVHALARDHLADHPDHLLVAWIAALHPEEKS